ncbi:RNA polymerase sigma factor [Pseudoclavibacter soli]|uniref:RNA polymerase sigma factor n=1 Tax=Pseudoclavibacter soli TaxID=452623 RepID=UPI000414C7B6|nr:sigma-70 family RNA polymerase sigma factor [Pseudoclavibacter soli]
MSRANGRSGASGADQEFDDLMAALLPDLVRYFARRIPDAHAAVDCAADTALIMYERFTQLPISADERRAWAFGIARNVRSSHLRKSVRRLEIDDALREVLVGEISDVAEVASRNEQINQVLRALPTLSSADQELLTLVVWDELQVQQAGAVVGLNPTAARKRYERARNRWRKAYAGLGSEA